MKKKLFLLASAVMGFALVGGTFASWAVTDNADPFSIKVSTGSVTTDEAEYVTLEWGEEQSMSNVANLALDTIRKAGVLDLRANTLSTTQTDGTLSYSISGVGAEHLMAALELKIYAGDIPATNSLIDPASLAGKTPVSFTNGEALLQVNKNEANLYTVAVNLKAGTDAADLDEMTGEKVEVIFDWGPGSDVLSTVTYYATGFGTTPYIYAWNGSQINAEFPGVPMEEIVGAEGYYSAELTAGYTKVIFTTADESQKSGDIVIAESFIEGKNLFTFNSEIEDIHGSFSIMPDIKEPEYYVVGTFTTEAWKAEAQNKMSLVAGETDIYVLEGITLEQDTNIKALQTIPANTWFGNESSWDNCGFTIGDDKNVVISNTGKYNVYLDLSPENGNFIFLTACDYYVVGDFTETDWAVEAANKMSLKAGETQVYELVGLELAAGAELKAWSVLRYYTDASTWEDCGFTLTDGDNNIKVIAAGTYTIELYLNANNGNFVKLVKTA